MHRTERLIAFGRIVLAAGSFVAMLVPLPEHPGHSPSIHPVLGAYTMMAVALAVLAGRPGVRLEQVQIAGHVADMAAYVLLMLLTTGVTSPFLAVFVFALIAATLRWQARGALWTAVVGLAAFIGVGEYGHVVRHDPDFEIGRFVARTVNLGVISIFAVILGLYVARLRGEMGRLAEWARESPPEGGEEARLSWILRKAALMMGAPRVLLIWAPGTDECAGSRGEAATVLWSEGRVSSDSWQRDPEPHAFSEGVSNDLTGASFLCRDVRDSGSAVLFGTGDCVNRTQKRPVAPELVRAFSMTSVVSAPLEAEGLSGRLFFLDRAKPSIDDLVLAAIVAREVGARLAESRAHEKARESATLAERGRLARDMHDGVLQSLTGTALQLERAKRLMARGSPGAQGAVDKAEQILVREQQELRAWVDGLRPSGEGRAAAHLDLDACMADLREKVWGLWGLEVDLELDDGLRSDFGDESLANDVCLIVHEGLVNGARHGGATRARVTLTRDGDSVCISIQDDGCGFPFRGSRSSDEFVVAGGGPWSLLQRVDSRGGSLTVDSGPTGSRVDIGLPVRVSS